jgi:glucose/arabinose dehydrogenase
MVRTATALIALLAGPALGAATIDGVNVEFERAGEGFERPVVIAPLPTDERLLVVEKTGIIRFLQDGRPGDVFLDLSGEVSNGNEQGLLGLAFDPGFAENGKFYVNYTDRSGDTQIVSFTAANGVADSGSATTLISIDQPEANHNGGWIAFGPDDLLYIGMGDGGGGGDRHGAIGNGQDKGTLLGKILRIDPNGGEPYAIPEGNPFADGGGAPEIFAYGLRNPWRNAFDGQLLYIADVGQGMWEEISVIDVADAAGANLGWRTMEGRQCFPAGTNCVQGGMVMPIHVYSHDEGCSITGGVVYRGTALPALQGRYFFADWCTGVIEALRHEGGEATAVVNTGAELGSLGNINAFGLDAGGELYVLTDDGAVLKMVPGDGSR